MTTMEVFYQAIFDANKGKKKETYNLDSPDKARELRDMLTRNRRVKTCSQDRSRNTVDVVFSVPSP